MHAQVGFIASVMAAEFPFLLFFQKALTYWRSPPPKSEFRVVIASSEGNLSQKTPKHMPEHALRSTFVLEGCMGYLVYHYGTLFMPIPVFGAGLLLWHC